MNVSFCWLANNGVSFSSSPPHVLLVLLGWFVRWEVSGRKATVLWGVTSRICSEQHIASLSTSHLSLSPRISIESMWCSHWYNYGIEEFILFYQRDQISNVCKFWEIAYSECGSIRTITKYIAFFLMFLELSINGISEWFLKLSSLKHSKHYT